MSLLLPGYLEKRAKDLTSGQFFAVKVSKFPGTQVCRVEDLAQQTLNDTKLSLFTSTEQRANIKAYMEGRKGTLFADRFRRRRRRCLNRC
jgi:hypothetical protein